MEVSPLEDAHGLLRLFRQLYTTQSCSLTGNRQFSAALEHNDGAAPRIVVIEIWKIELLFLQVTCILRVVLVEHVSDSPF